MKYEGYKNVKGYEGLYIVNPNGEIITLRNKNGRRGTKIKPYKDCDGYMRVKLYDSKGKTKWIGVHKVVATTFLPNPRGCISVNHKNYIRDDNRVENIEWCTSKENVEWSSSRYKGHGHLQVKATDKFGNETIYKSLSDASKITGVCVANICRCCKGRTNTAGGLKWNYEEITITRG